MKALARGWWTAVPVVIYLASWASNYWFGYAESFEVGLVSDPILLLLTEFLLFAALAIWIIARLVKRKPCRVHLITLAAFWPVLIALFRLLPPAPVLIVHGLRDRILHDYTLADLRAFGHDAEQAGLVGMLDGGTRDFTEEQHQAFDRLKTHYRFLTWFSPNGRDGVASIYTNGGTLYIDWGGALIGHHGFSINTDGYRNDPAPNRDVYDLRASDDIYFFFE